MLYPTQVFNLPSMLMDIIILYIPASCVMTVWQEEVPLPTSFTAATQQL